MTHATNSLTWEANTHGFSIFQSYVTTWGATPWTVHGRFTKTTWLRSDIQSILGWSIIRKFRVYKFQQTFSSHTKRFTFLVDYSTCLCFTATQVKMGSKFAKTHVDSSKSLSFLLVLRKYWRISKITTPHFMCTSHLETKENPDAQNVWNIYLHEWLNYGKYR